MPTADELFAEASRHHREGQASQARLALGAAVAADPGHVPALHLLGLTALQGGRPAEAADLLRRAVDRLGRHLPASRDLGRAAGGIDGPCRPGLRAAHQY
jgi:cytochrome c-type biogenesis protein CcmH/NrfG